MRHFIRTLAVLTALAPLPVLAQSAAPAAPSAASMKGIATSKEVVELIAKAKAKLKEGAPIAVERIEGFAPFMANLEYRVAAAPTMVHEKTAEFFYVVDGSGTLTLGGKLKDEKRLNPDNLTGSGVEGGAVLAVNKGDLLLAPPGTAHAFAVTKGPLVMVSIHFPVK